MGAGGTKARATLKKHQEWQGRGVILGADKLPSKNLQLFPGGMLIIQWQREEVFAAQDASKTAVCYHVGPWA